MSAETKLLVGLARFVLARAVVDAADDTIARGSFPSEHGAQFDGQAELQDLIDLVEAGDTEEAQDAVETGRGR